MGGIGVRIRDLDPIVLLARLVWVCACRGTSRIRNVQMAQVIPEEVNVFYIPHLRMKQLVNVYLEQVN
jgi:hypothetical protein